MSAAITLTLGRWQAVLADVECDALITDPPYSERCHAGLVSGRRNDGGKPTTTNYAHLTPDDVREMVNHWAPRTRGWMVVLTDHVLWPHYEEAMQAHDRYVFAPLACVVPGSRVRMAGDGPANWTVWACISRPRTAEFARWGALPGAYITRSRKPTGITGGRSIQLMEALIRDYSRSGDLVCDPYAGAGTTLIAAANAGRVGVGAECDPDHYAICQRRFSARQPDLFPTPTEQTA